MSNIFWCVTITALIANLMASAADNYLQARRRCAADIALVRRDQGWVGRRRPQFRDQPQDVGEQVSN